MIEATGHTLWIEPKGEFLRRVSGVIKDLSARFGTQVFMPHVTLLGGIDQSPDQLTAEATKLAAETKPFPINLIGKIVCDEGNWTRTMIILADETPQLMQLYQRTVEVFGIKNPRPYKPHLSLMYAEDVSMSDRLAVARTLQGQSLATTLSVTNLSLVRTVGQPETWIKIRDFNLAG